MTRLEKKLFFQTGALGLAITLFIAFFDQVGWLNTLELKLSDTRALYFQHYRKKPTDQLVHLDMDDASIDAIGRPPWSRDKWAKMMDELNGAGVKVVAMDVEFQDPEDPFQKPGEPVVNPDPLMAASLDRFRSQPGRGVLLPMNFNINAPKAKSELFMAAVEELDKDPEMDDATLSAKLIARGFPEEDVRLKTNSEHEGALQQVLYERLKHEADLGHPMDMESLRARLLPHSAATGQRNDALRALEKVLPRFESYEAMLRFSRAPPAGLPPLLSQDEQAVPIPILARAAAYSGFVDLWKVDDDRVRCIPLWLMNRGRVAPQLGLAMACAQLGVNPNDLILTADSVTIPIPGGKAIVIPVYTRRGGDGVEVGMLMDIPWWGKADGWQTMYDWPSYKTPAQHLPMTAVWDICKIEPDIIDNNKRAYGEVLTVDATQDPDANKALAVSHPDFTDTAAWNKLMDDTVSNIPPDTADTYKDYLSNAKNIDDLTDPKAHDMVLALRNLGSRQKVNGELERNRTELRNKLRRQLQDKAVLIGWIASGEMDFRATPLDKECPGVVVHGAIFNAIMTRDLLTREPPWVSLLWTLAIGTLVSAASAVFPPVRSLACTVIIVAVFIWFDFSFAYDQHRMEINAAGPPTAAVFIWTICNLIRYLVEQKEKMHITERFRSYVDPSLVNYVLEHPEKATLEGEERELSVVFTDLQGFTSVSEILKRDTVSLLNEYLGLMVPVISRHHGFLNKFLGDGIMFFFGAPEPYPGDPLMHATAAVRAVVEMQAAMIPFNEELVRRRLPALKMRAGVSTGDMVVGDAGPRGRSDYTVLGDRVNFAARLESANKYTGTPILISDRTVELLQNRYLVRPIGRLQVVGKNEPVLTYEPLVAVEDATPEHQKLVDMTRSVTESYAAGHFADCIAATHELLTSFGEASQGKLCALYRRLSLEYLRVPPKDFRGQIKLEAK